MTWPRKLYFGRSHATAGRGLGRPVAYKVSYEAARRPPRKGEWYLSGAIPEGYLAPNDLSTPHVIIIRGDKIEPDASRREMATA